MRIDECTLLLRARKSSIQAEKIVTLCRRLRRRRPLALPCDGKDADADADADEEDVGRWSDSRRATSCQRSTTSPSPGVRSSNGNDEGAVPPRPIRRRGRRTAVGSAANSM